MLVSELRPPAHRPNWLCLGQYLTLLTHSNLLLHPRRPLLPTTLSNLSPCPPLKLTTTSMNGTRFYEQTCVRMWEQVDEVLVALGGQCQDFEDLTSIWYRNLEEYAITGTVESGDFPFVVEFCTSDWLPQLKDDVHNKLLDYFCELDEDGKLCRTKAEFYRSISEDKGRDELKTTLSTHKNLKFRVSIE